jgi:hypothetical protein
MTNPVDIETPIVTRQKPRASFYLSWILLTSLCVPVAYFLSFIPLSLIVRFVGDFIYVNGVQHITEDYLGLYVIVPMIGLLTGLVQYGMLRPYLPHIGGWVLVTMGSWLLGFLLIALLNRLKWIDINRNFDVVFLLMGLSIGVTQWLLLRQRLPWAVGWIAANIIGWGLLALITKGSGIDQYGLFIIGLLPACATAGMLALLLSSSNDSTVSRLP